MARGPFSTANYLGAETPPVTAAPVTIMAWFYPTANPTGGQFLVSLNNSASSSSSRNLFAILCGAGTTDAVFGFVAGHDTNSTLINVTAVEATRNAWNCGIGIAESVSSRYAYLNGTASVQSTVTRAPTGINRWSVGVARGSAVGSGAVSMRIGEVAVWKIALSAAQRATLESGISALSVAPANLVAYVPMFGSGDEVDWEGGSLTQTGSVAAVDHPRIIYPRTRVWTPKAAAVSGAPTLSALTAISITSTSAQPSLTYTY